jgi:DNA-binding SARP family transcriptional activator/tetratricopeptide (TPR) repeat protein
MPFVRFRLLGQVVAEGSAGPVDVGGATARAVLAVLLIRGDAGASAGEIITAVWGGPGGATRDSVYHYLSRLRGSLTAAGVVLETRQPRYRLVVDPDDVDWHRFRRLAASARQARDSGQPDRAAGMLRDALALWTGPPLADVGDRLLPSRQDMSSQRRAAVEALAEVAASQGHPDEVVDLLRGELIAGPVRERAAALMMGALTELGRRDEAGEVYRRTRARLVAEQGLDPGAELAAAHRRVLEPLGPRPAPAPTPISGLPRLDVHFTGRDRELRQLASALAPGSPTTCVIHGMAGSGKTSLAVQAAHALAAVFPDGIIFLDLHGYATQRMPLNSAEALDRILRRMRLDAAMIPDDPDERAALYHDLLGQRRMLVVLDNAHDASQLTPLLPGSPGCAAIITSRRKLAALDDVRVLPLDVLSTERAVALFRSVAGTGRLSSEPAAEDLVTRIVGLCGRLPLAVRITAGRYRARDNQPLAELADHLARDDERLAELDDSDRSVAASFLASLVDLPPPLARTFALLAAGPGADIDPLAAAALCDLSLGEATRQLGYLADRHLIAEQTRCRYQFHDLIRVFARRYALGELPAPEQAAALRRLLDYFLRAAEAADVLITPHRYRVLAEVLDRDVCLPVLGSYQAGLAWLSQEQGNLAEACLAAGEAGFDVACWQLAYTLRGFYFLSKNWLPWIATHECALAATRRCADVRAEAMIVNNLGLAHLERGASDLAADCYRRARQLFAAVPDPHGENTARSNLAWLLSGEGRFAEFIAEMQPVLAFYRDTGSERNAAITLRGIGLAEAELGMIMQSVADLREALDIFVRLGLRLDAAMSWNGLGETYQHADDIELASQAFRAALTISEQAGSEFELARAHHRLGQLAAASGDHTGARGHWEEALRRYRQLKAPQTTQVQQDLAGLDRYS